MHKGKVVILLATYNRAHLIRETLNSIQKQTYPNWECVIVDDYSKDNTENVVQEFIKGDIRFTFYKKNKKFRKGLSDTRNMGIKIAIGRNPEFIQFFDDDDIMHPKKLEIQVDLLNENDNADFCLCGNRNFKEISKIRWKDKQQLNFDDTLTLGEAFLMGKIRFAAQVPLFKASYICQFSFDPDLAYAEEWVLFSQIFNITQPKYCVTEKVLFFRRKHSESITEMPDYAWNKLKTSQVTGLKVFEALKEHSALSKILLYHFTFYFLVNQYNSRILKEIKFLMHEGGSEFKIGLLKYRTVLYINKFYRKTILKILGI